MIVFINTGILGLLANLNKQKEWQEIRILTPTKEFSRLSVSFHFFYWQLW
jgi:hypothetical protein